MKIAISIPDKTTTAADKLAKKLKVSRSALYAKAVEELLQRHDSQAITVNYNRVAEKINTSLTVVQTKAAKKILASVEWED